MDLHGQQAGNDTLFMNFIYEVSEFIVSNMAADVYMPIEDANEERRRGRQKEVSPAYVTASGNPC